MATNNLQIVISAVNTVGKTLTDIRRDFSQTKEAIAGVGGVNLGGLEKQLGGLGANAKAAAATMGGLKDTASQLEGAFAGAVRGAKFLAGGFLAIQAVGFVKSLADVAARAETLDIVLGVVGKNAGYTRDELTKADKAVQRLGITADASRESLTRLLQAKIPLDFAAPFARAAQDLAVVSGEGSSETMQRLVTNVQQMDTQGLKFMGLIVDREAALARAAALAGRELTKTEQVIAFGNATLAAAAGLTGTYEASMSSAGKQLSSLPRIIKEIQLSIGNLLLPAYAALVQATGDILKAINSMMNTFAGVKSATGDSATGMFTLADAITSVSGKIVDFIKWMERNKNIILLVVDALQLLATAWVALKVIGVVTSLITGAIAAFGVVSGAVATFTGLLALGTGGLVAFIGTLATLFAPVTLAVAAIAALGFGAYKLYEYFNKSKDAIPSDTILDGAAAFKAYSKAMEESTAVSIRLKKVSEELRDVQSKEFGATTDAQKAQLAAQKAQLTAEQKDLSEQRKVLDAQLKKAGEALDKAPGNEGLKKQREDLEKADAAKRASDIADAARIQARTDALKAIGIDVGVIATGIDEKTNTILNGIESGLTGLTKGTDEARRTMTLLLVEYNKLANDISSPEALARFNALSAALSGKNTELGLPSIDATLNAGKATAAAQLKERQAVNKAGNAQIIAQRKAHAAAVVALTAQTAKEENSLSRIAVAEAAAINENAYADNLISASEYYARKRDLAKRESALELKDIAADLKKAESAPSGTQAERDSKKAEIQALSARRQEVLARETGVERATLREQENQRKDVELRVAQLKRDLLSTSVDREAAAIATLNAQYEEKIRKAGSTDEAAALRSLQVRDVEALKLSQANELLTKRISLETSLLDLTEATVNLQRRSSALTSNQAEDIRNRLILARVELLRRQQAAQQAIYDQNKDNKDNATTAADAQAQVLQFETQIAQLKGSLKDFGDTLQQVFTDSLSSGIEKLLDGTQNIGQVLKGVQNDLIKSVNQNISRNLAETAAGALTSASSKDGGGGIFASLGSLFSGQKTKTRGEKPTDPLFVNVVKGLPAAPGAAGGAGGAGGDGAGINLEAAAQDPAGTALAYIKEQAGEAFKGFEDVSREALSSVGAVFQGVGGTVFDSIKGLGTGIGEAFSGISESLTAEGGGISGLFSSMSESLSGVFSSLSGQASGGGLGLGELASSLGNTLTSIFSSLTSSSGGSGGGDGGVGSLFNLAASFFAEGGPINGPGTGTSDSVPIWGSAGEYVVNAKSTAAWLPFLNAINFGKMTPSAVNFPGRTHFASGGSVMPARGSPVQSIAQGQRPSVTVVQNITTPDANSFRKSQAQLQEEAMRSADRATSRNS